MKGNSEGRDRKCKATLSKYKGATASKCNHTELNIEDPTALGDKHSKCVWGYDCVYGYECLLHAWGHSRGSRAKCRGPAAEADMALVTHTMLVQCQAHISFAKGTHTYAGCVSCHLFTRAVKPSWVLSRAPLCFIVVSMCRNRWPMSASCWGSKRCC